MILENLTVEERKRATRAYPVAVVGAPGNGKSASIEFLPAEEKKRTVIFNLDKKGLPEDDEEDYFKVIEVEEIGVFTERVKKAIMNPNVDRVIIDTFTGFVADIDAYCTKTYNGFAIWNKYNQAISDFLNMLKVETKAHHKFVYLFGHYKPAKDKKDPDAEKYMVVRGKEHFRLIESNFNTVIEATKDSTGFRFIADNLDEFSSSRVRRSLSPLETKQNNLAELEEILAGEL